MAHASAKNSPIGQNQDCEKIAKLNFKCEVKRSHVNFWVNFRFWRGPQHTNRAFSGSGEPRAFSASFLARAQLPRCCRAPPPPPPPPQFDGFVIYPSRIIRFADSPCTRREYVLILFYEKVLPTPKLRLYNATRCTFRLCLHLHSMAESDKENRSLSKTTTSKGYTAKVFHDPEHNSRNTWQLFRLFLRKLNVFENNIF